MYNVQCTVYSTIHCRGYIEQQETSEIVIDTSPYPLPFTL